LTEPKKPVPTIAQLDRVAAYGFISYPLEEATWLATGRELRRYSQMGQSWLHTTWLQAVCEGRLKLHRMLDEQAEQGSLTAMLQLSRAANRAQQQAAQEPIQPAPDPVHEQAIAAIHAGVTDALARQRAFQEWDPPADD
jgi:hypothetical protein